MESSNEEQVQEELAGTNVKLDDASIEAEEYSCHLKLENAVIEFSQVITPRFTLTSDNADDDVKPFVIFPKHLPKIVAELPSLYVIAKLAQDRLDGLKESDSSKIPDSETLFEKVMIKSKMFRYKLRVDTFQFKSYIKLQMYVQPPEKPNEEFPCHGAITFSPYDNVDELKDFVTYWVTKSKVKY
jgi:hypothetical protein